MFRAKPPSETRIMALAIWISARMSPLSSAWSIISFDRYGCMRLSEVDSRLRTSTRASGR